jgi:hypothetical protein
MDHDPVLSKDEVPSIAPLDRVTLENIHDAHPYRRAATINKPAEPEWALPPPRSVSSGVFLALIALLCFVIFAGSCVVGVIHSMASGGC